MVGVVVQVVPDRMRSMTVVLVLRELDIVSPGVVVNWFARPLTPA